MGEDWTKNPPSWATDAIATEAGWTDKNTGELLVAMRGLNTRYLNRKKPVKKKKDKPVFEVTFPDGHKEQIYEVKSFAEKHGLQPTHLYKVMSGKLKHHKHFKINRIEPKKKLDTSGG